MLWNALWICLILITPYCLGLPWRSLSGAKGRGASFFFAYVTGYFIRPYTFPPDLFSNGVDAEQVFDGM